jgi:hypothetical protein
VAEQLGEAVLKITIDDSLAKDKLGELREEIGRIESRTSGARRSTSSGTRGVSGPTPPPITNRNEVRQFNLRGTIAALESIAEDIGRISEARQGTRQINIGSSWTRALQLLQETKEDIDSISASRTLNLRSSWNTALAQLGETKEDIDSISATKNLNIRSSWNTFLAKLGQTKADLDNVAAAKDINLRSSWSSFLTDLTQTKTDIDTAAAARRINIKSSWTKFLGELEQTAQDLERLRRSPATQAAINRSLERQAEVRTLQTAGGGGGGLTNFLRDVRLREEKERNIAAIRKAGYKDAQFAEKVLTAATDNRLKKETAVQRRRSRSGGPGAGGIISSALIGGAFPLLFGQGGGAAGGGLIGGLLGGAFGGGGGFAGSLVGTLVGQTADKFGELAKALQDPIKNFDALIQGANLSGKGVEELAKVLIDLGRTSEANALIQADLARTIDPVGILKVASANDAFARTVGDIQERIGFLLAGPATQFISWIDQIIRRVVNLPDGRPTGQGALATRGQGTGLGIGGVLLAATGLAAAPFTGGASLPLALGGFGLAAAGGAQIASAEFQQQQIADSAAIEKLQQNIATIEERRIRIQRDISAAVLGGRKNTEAELRLQDQLLQLDAQREQAKAAFIAAPLDDTGTALRALRSQIAAIDLQKRAAVDAEDQRKRALQATASLEATQNQLALQSVAERIAAARQLAGVEQGVVRSTIEQALTIKNSIAEARRRERDIGAQITAARQVGDETAAARLVGQQRVAAEETKLRIIEGATALRDAGVQLRKDLDAAFLNLQKLRTGTGGLNQFLGGQDRARREQDVFKALLPRFREAQSTFAQLTGARAPEFSGPTASVNQTILQFIDAVKAEEQALNNTVDTQRALSENTAALAQITGELRTTIAELNAKNWAVNVNVAADGTSQISGDTINSALSIPS